MKQLLFILIFSSSCAYAQCDSSDVVFPDVDAEFPDGTAAMLKFIQQNMEYPEIQFTEDFGGRLYIKFIVCSDGTITNVQCLRCSNSDLDRMAIDLVEKMPKWIPATVDGKPVTSLVRFPINIHLN